MGEYDRTGNGQSSKTDWDLRSILCDIAKNWWVILLIACSVAMITYTVIDDRTQRPVYGKNHICRYGTRGGCQCGIEPVGHI